MADKTRFTSAPDSLIRVSAVSSLHEVSATIAGVKAQATFDPADPAGTLELSAEAKLGDMKGEGSRIMGAGMEAKMRRYFEFKKYPLARFELEGIKSKRGKFRYGLTGTLSIRGRDIPLEFDAEIDFDEKGAAGVASFELTFADIGVKPLKLLMFKVYDPITVTVELHVR